MTLQVPFDDFEEAVRRYIPDLTVYLRSYAGGTVLSSVDPAHQIAILSSCRLTPFEAGKQLKEAGFSVGAGQWYTADAATLDSDPLASVVVGAVAYRSGEDRPGLWVDAYAEMPSEVDVLQAMYDDLRSTGELGEVPFEEFVRQSNATVVTVTAENLRQYIAAKRTEP
jgi:hypothetical protein